MKKNYISRLRQYDARTSLKDKQTLYTKKFLKTCYDAVDKQNEDPNISIKKIHTQGRCSGKKMKICQSNQTRCSETKKQSIQDEKNQQRQVSQFREIHINPYQCEFDKKHNARVLYLAQDKEKKVICCQECSLKYLNKTLFFDHENSNNLEIGQKKWTILTNIKLQSVQFQRFLRQKQSQEVQKCNNYYEYLINLLKNQQKDTLNYINDAFQLNYDKLTQKMTHIQSIISDLDERLVQNQSIDYFCSCLYPQDTEIDFNMVAININDDIIAKAKLEISKLDLKNIGFLIQSEKQKEKLTNRTSFHSRTIQALNEQSLSCKEQFIEPKITKIIKNQLDISFQQNEDFILGGDCPIIEYTQPQPCGVSPSFKYF